jgi:hypothetical protein
MRAFEQIYGYHLVKNCGHCDVCNRKLVIKPLTLCSRPRATRSARSEN